MKATTKWMASTGLILGLLVGCSNQPTVEEVGQAFNSLTEEEQAQGIEEYVAPIIEKALEDAFGEAILIEEENEEVLTDSVLNELVQNIVWVHGTDTWGTTTTVGILDAVFSRACSLPIKVVSSSLTIFITICGAVRLSITFAPMHFSVTVLVKSFATL